MWDFRDNIKLLIFTFQVTAVFLFTEGSSCDGSRMILKEKLSSARVPLHIVSYNCTDPSTIEYLKELCRITGGR